ncbi:hypothetical protein V8B97DRAFT_1921060 [Scleroderma yunnanense]
MANIQSNGIYALKNVEADSYLDLSGSDRHSSTYDTVEWQFIHQGYGNFQIKSVADGQYLGIDGPPANGVRVVAVSTPFMWTIQRDPVHSQAIRSKHGSYQIRETPLLGRMSNCGARSMAITKFGASGESKNNLARNESHMKIQHSWTKNAVTIVVMHW